MTAPDEHNRLRELLGAYALGGLPDDAAAGVRAHLDGCPTCRAELAEIAPLADELRTVDLGALALHLRDDTAAFVVVDASGTPVMTAQL